MQRGVPSSGSVSTPTAAIRAGAFSGPPGRTGRLSRSVCPLIILEEEVKEEIEEEEEGEEEEIEQARTNLKS